MRSHPYIFLTVMLQSWSVLSAGPAQPLHSVSSPCTQQGGNVECKAAVVTPWQYRLKDNPARYHASEDTAYASLLDSHEPASVFTLMHRWSATNPLDWPQTRLHGIEISSWKIYRRCVPDPTEFDCDTHPEYLGYQRVRQVSCPPGYGFGADPESPYCLPQQDAAAKLRRPGVASLTGR